MQEKIFQKLFVKKDILIVGSICGSDIVFGEYLARMGLNVVIARPACTRFDYTQDVPKNFCISLSKENFYMYRNRLELIKLARKSLVVLSLGGAFGFKLRELWLFRKLLGLPPVINQNTGSDFAELLGASSFLGWAYRYFTSKVFVNLALPYPYVIKEVAKAKMQNVIFASYAHIIPDLKSSYNNYGNKKIKFFHPSNLDFGVNDSNKNRRSTKGNDKFIRALFRAFDSGLDAECVLLYRGPDCEVAKKMIESSKWASKFIWKKGLDRDNLYNEMICSDIIVDQFDIGGVGGIAVEAMALARPVLMYVNENASRLSYSTPPPVLNARTENEIYIQIINASDKQALHKMGIKSREWVLEHYSPENALKHIVRNFEVLSRKSIINYGTK